MIRHSLTAAAAAAVLVLVPAAAYAGTETHHDSTGDVLHAAEDRGNAIFGKHKEPGRTESDIKWMRTVHAPHAVRVRVQFRELKRVGQKAFDLGFKLPGGAIVRATIFADDIGWKGRLSSETDTRITFKIDYDLNAVFVTVPRIVLGQPVWVRSAFVVDTVTLTAADENAHHHVDDARLGYTGQYLGADARTFGPRVFQ